MKTKAARRRPWWPMAILAAMTVLLIGWCWPRPGIELSQDGYDVTLALYRVCNQRSIDGLAAIERRWTEICATRPADSADPVIPEIIRQAQSGQWDHASILCRRALEDQVK